MIDSNTHKNEKKNKVIAVCYAGSNMEYQKVVIDKLTNYGEELGYNFLFFVSFGETFGCSRHDIGELNIYNLPNFRLVDGVIILSETLKDNESIRKIVLRATEAGKPVVSLDKMVDGCYNILFDYEYAIEQIVRHFIEYHHFTRINFIAGEEGNPTSDERLNSYKNVLTKYGIKVEQERIGYGYFWHSHAYNVTQRFCESELELPQAIVCANDAMAIGACDYLLEHNYRVPEDICVSGFDGIQEAMQHFPKFTTACQDFESASICCLDILKNVFEGNPVEKRYTIPSKILYSQSCGCEKASQYFSNKCLRDSNNEINEMDTLSKRLIYMFSDLSIKSSMEETILHMQEYIKKIYSKRVWVCAIENFVDDNCSLDNIFNRDNYCKFGYTNKMKVLIYREFQEIIELPEFEVSSMLPDLYRNLEECKNIMFMPLHFQDKTIGYLAMEFTPPTGNFNKMYSFIMNLSNVFETIRTQNELKTIIKRLEEMYTHDHLTGLCNRRGFYQNICRLLEYNKSNNIMIASIDLDGLKYINDTFGHNEGDNAIKTVAKTLLSSSAKGEVCARFGGDEFIVAGVGNVDTQYVKEYLDGFNQLLEYYNKHSDKPYRVQASCGIVLEKITDNINIETMIKAADENMYEQKRNHKRIRGEKV